MPVVELVAAITVWALSRSAELDSSTKIAPLDTISTAVVSTSSGAITDPRSSDVSDDPRIAARAEASATRALRASSDAIPHDTSASTVVAVTVSRRDATALTFTVRTTIAKASLTPPNAPLSMAADTPSAIAIRTA